MSSTTLRARRACECSPVTCAVPKLVIAADQQLAWLRCSAVFADQTAEDLTALDPGGEVDDAAGLAKRRFLLQALMRPLAVISAGRTRPQDLAEMTLAEDQHLVQALAAQCFTLAAQAWIAARHGSGAGHDRAHRLTAAGVTSSAAVLAVASARPAGSG